MCIRKITVALMTAWLSAAGAQSACAQDGHATHGAHALSASADMPAETGQAAFAAIAEVVRVLVADPQTDWRRVRIEALRQHLLDMNNVVLNATVSDVPIENGMRFDVTGTGDTAESIRRMARMHAAQPDATEELVARVSDIPGGARVSITTRRAADTRTIAKIRALGFAGWLALGEHHAAHHVMIARGELGH